VCYSRKSIEGENKVELGMYTLSLPIKRPFRWRTLWILVALWFLANLAAIPLLRATNAPIEPVWRWAVYTAVMTVLIGIGLYLATRTGLGAPLLEGQLKKDEIRDWARGVLALALLTAIVGSWIILSMSVSADPERYPAIWQLILASIKAGVTEEIFMRVLLMSLFVWLGSFISKDKDGRPTPVVFWVAIILCALLFGGIHVESRLSIPGVTVGGLTIVMIVNTSFGIILGWLFWKLGLECAMFAHFLIDALASAVVVPAYLAGNLLLQVTVLSSLILGCIWSLGVLVRMGSEAEPDDGHVP
jgi:hypothetical protein